MSVERLSFLVDPRPSGATAPSFDVFAEEHEFARAARELGPRIARGLLPPEVAVHLYAYEPVERIRERRAAGETRETCVVPFCPASLARVTLGRAHAVREILSLLPPDPEVAFRPAPPEEVAARCREIFGAVWFDAERYADDLLRRAADRGWERA